MGAPLLVLVCSLALLCSSWAQEAAHKGSKNDFGEPSAKAESNPDPLHDEFTDEFREKAQATPSSATRSEVIT